MAVLCVLLLDSLAVACVLTGIVQIIPVAGASAADRLAPELKPSGASCCIYQESLGLMLHLFLEEAQLPRCEDHETLMVLVVGDRASVGVGSSFCAGKRFKIRQQ